MHEASIFTWKAIVPAPSCRLSLAHSLLHCITCFQVGHASSHDAYLLLKQYYVNVCSVFDTYPLTRDLCLPMESLRGLAGTMLGMQLTKTQAMTNWENRNLSDLQLQYASTDAWVSLEAYKALVR